MGCMSSNPERKSSNDINDKDTQLLKQPEPNQQITLLDQKNQKLKRKTSAHGGFMHSVAMKFPQIRKSFSACRSVFDKYAEGRTSIPKSQMKPMLIELGAKPELLTQEEIDKIFKISKLQKKEKFEFKEFLIAAAVGCFLNQEIDGQSNQFLMMRKGFAAAQEAFNKIDRDGSGQIQFDELQAAFLSMRQDELINERLRELDFSANKPIELPEFVWGITAWVGMDENSQNEDEISRNSTDAHSSTANTGNDQKN